MISVKRGRFYDSHRKIQDVRLATVLAHLSTRISTDD